MKNNYYKDSLKAFKKILKYNKNITEEEWNTYAHKNSLFSSITLISKANLENFEELKEQYKWF